MHRPSHPALEGDEDEGAQSTDSDNDSEALTSGDIVPLVSDVHPVARGVDRCRACDGPGAVESSAAAGGRPVCLSGPSTALDLYPAYIRHRSPCLTGKVLS